MKKKNGFTLIELLAVIVILSIIISMSTFGVMRIRNNSLKKLLDTKINELEASAILYGQENQSSLGGACTVEGVESKFCKVITVKELIDSDYYKSNEVNSSNKKDLINNVTNKSMLCDEIQIYKKNNRVYAKALNIKSNDVNNVCDKSY